MVFQMDKIKNNSSSNNNYRKPKIIKLKAIDSNESEIIDFDDYDLDFPASSKSFIPNQNVKIEIFDESLLEITTLQSTSTPGVIMRDKIRVKPGNYIFTVVGYSQYGRTFFPWVRDVTTKLRLSETIHLSSNEEPINVHFSIKDTCVIEIGVLAHRQEIGDNCYLRSFHVSKQRTSYDDVDEIITPFLVDLKDLIPHHETNIKIDRKGALIKSSSYSTPGTYAILDVLGIEIISISVSVLVKYPSTGFLYAADSLTGKELTRRNYILESNVEGEDANLLAAIKLPKGTNKIRLGILFSKSKSVVGHEMIIKKIEAVEYRSVSTLVDKTYVLNLEDEKEKFLISLRQSERFGLDISRWLAENGLKKSNYSKWQEYMEEPWTDQDKILNRKSIDKPGAWGYLLSMRSIFIDAIENNYESILVFDDDFILSKYFDHDFSKLISTIPNDWNILYLGASQWSWDSAKITEKLYYDANSDTNGTFAVIYKKNTFSRLISAINKMDSPFDAGPLRELILSKSDNNSYVAFPNLVIANLQKDGIRDSRDQLEYSKKFRWDLDKFPPNFMSWSSKPVLLRDESSFSMEYNKKHFVTAVTTVNRISYLKNFLKGWENTRSKVYNHTLIIADDGSTDGTLSWITEELYLDDARIIVLQNDGRGIARQSNSIIDKITNLDVKPDLIFMCNDDINFIKKGWDERYYDSTKKSGFGHLVYFNPEWKNPSHSLNSNDYSFLHSSCSAIDVMGCFYTLTLEIIKKIGFFDENSFPIRGHSHIDYTMRICNMGGNVSKNIYDVSDSNEYVSMIMRDNYVRTNKILSVKEILLLSSQSELDKRLRIMNSTNRSFINKGW